jgi:hypothetical protein
MADRNKEYDLSLLQKDAAREAVLSKMKGRLAGVVAPAVVHATRKKARDRGQALTWTVRILSVAMVAGINYLLLDKKDVLLAKIGFEGVPSLPKPSQNLSVDEQALYYAYALYDIGKFRKHFHAVGYPGVDQAGARRRLEELLPRVSLAVQGEISAYAPVGYRAITAGGRP